MKKLLKWFAGLFLLPLCWAFSRSVFGLLKSAPSGSSAWAEWALPCGFAVSVTGFFLLPKPFRTYVLAHELTHAVWGALMGAKVGRIKIGKNGGHVMLSKSNFLISLAPYFFPFYTGLVIAVWYAARLFADLSACEPWWLAAVGLTWGFHVTFTVYMLSRRQPDIHENGRLFSYTVIYLANLFFAAVWMVAIGVPSFSELCAALISETASAYGRVWGIVSGLWRRM